MRLVLTYMLLWNFMGTLKGYCNEKCQRNLVGWTRIPIDTVIISGKKVKVPPSDTVFYRVTILKIAHSCSTQVSELPAYVDERKNDTMYSASDGGFLFGIGVTKWDGSSVSIRGKHTKLWYIATKGDSTFQFELVQTGNGIWEHKTKTRFSNLSNDQVTELLARWGLQHKK